jgi:hypothetical protein
LLSRTAPAAKLTRLSFVPWMICALMAFFPAANARAADASSGAKILSAAEAGKLLPASVFFRGQSASTQARNSGGVKMADGMLVLCTLVDTSGYSTAVQQKYQAYFITEVTLEINGQALKPGAYGVGFIEGSKFIVMDIGGHDLFTESGTRDAALKRPTPLQILADSSPEHYRLYINRNYVTFAATRGQ